MLTKFNLDGRSGRRQQAKEIDMQSTILSIIISIRSPYPNEQGTQTQSLVPLPVLKLESWDNNIWFPKLFSLPPLSILRMSIVFFFQHKAHKVFSHLY